MLKGCLIVIISVHPRKGEENIRGILAFQHHSQQVFIVIRLPIGQLHIGINLIKTVKFSLQRLKVGIASDHSDFTAGIWIEPWLEHAGGFRVHRTGAGHRNDSK